jgi:hypothetical protein
VDAPRTSLELSDESLTAPLATYRRPDTLSWENAWIGIEPTFTNARALRRWTRLTQKEGGEVDFFWDKYMLRTERQLALAIQRTFERLRRRGEDTLFDRVVLTVGEDEWGVKRQELDFQWRDRSTESFNVRVGLDPEVFEYSCKPVPLGWFYDERFLGFLQRVLFDVPERLGLAVAAAHGGGQFHASAKTLLQGSLLADDIAYRLDHPELACWTMDAPSPDGRAFRATRERRRAFERVLDAYWSGCFHPRAIGVLTVENALMDRGFDPAALARPELMDQRSGPIGGSRDIFQTNFAFARTVRLRAQNVHPGYWQSAHPDEYGYRPDQIMRYSEGNLNRLQIRGELHVKSGVPLERVEAPEFDLPLEISMLTREASWEYRAQASRTSARDWAEAVLLEMHHAQYLQRHPHVRLRGSLLQDQLLADAAETLQRRGKSELLARLHRQARKLNLAESRGRMKSDWIEPETLFWAAWKALGPAERAEIAREAVCGFAERVQQASTVDPRPGAPDDPMRRHRHRVHPLLWKALAWRRSSLKPGDLARRELDAYAADRRTYAARRPMWSPGPARPPW